MRACWEPSLWETQQGHSLGPKFVPPTAGSGTFLFFDYPTDVGNLISGFSAFSNSSLNIWKFTVHMLLKPSLENFEHYFTSM